MGTSQEGLCTPSAILEKTGIETGINRPILLFLELQRLDIPQNKESRNIRNLSLLGNKQDQY